MTLGRTIKRACAIAAVSAAALALGGVTASADGEEPDTVPDHGHILLIGDRDGGFRKCVDLAGGKTVPLVAHHERVHATAIVNDRGVNVKGIRQAGHAVFPTALITPWDDCAGFADFLSQP